MPGTPEFDIFIKEVRKEMTVKCGQKCTAIRRIIVPEKLIEDVQIAIGQQLDKVTIGDPRLKEVSMGAMVSKDQVQEVKERVVELTKTAKMVHGNLDEVSVIGANSKDGAFLAPVLLREDYPFTNTGIHEIEAFGPVSTLMPYKTLDEAIHLAHLGKGSLVSSIVTNSDSIAKEYVVEAATHHGRICLLYTSDAADE